MSQKKSVKELDKFTIKNAIIPIVGVISSGIYAGTNNNYVYEVIAFIIILSILIVFEFNTSYLLSISLDKKEDVLKLRHYNFIDKIKEESFLKKDVIKLLSRKKYIKIELHDHRILKLYIEVMEDREQIKDFPILAEEIRRQHA